MCAKDLRINLWKLSVTNQFIRQIYLNFISIFNRSKHIGSSDCSWRVLVPFWKFNFDTSVCRYWQLCFHSKQAGCRLSHLYRMQLFCGYFAKFSRFNAFKNKVGFILGKNLFKGVQKLNFEALGWERRIWAIKDFLYGVGIWCFGKNIFFDWEKDRFLIN